MLKRVAKLSSRGRALSGMCQPLKDKFCTYPIWRDKKARVMRAFTMANVSRTFFSAWLRSGGFPTAA